MERRINKNGAGFVLMEMMVALFIFALIITTIVAVFVASFRSQNYSKDFQKNLENVRVAMESMAKTIRTSALDYPTVSGTAGEIYVYDYSQEKCIGYEFVTESEKKTLKFREKEMGRINAAGDGIVDCMTELQGETSFDFIGNMEISEGTFYVRRSVQETDPAADDGHMGKVTIVINLGNDFSPFETTVSLRDY